MLKRVRATIVVNLSVVLCAGLVVGLGQKQRVRLSPVDLLARVVVPEALRKGVKARLVPRHDKLDIGGLPSGSPAQELPTRTATLAADGTLRFDNVRPDRYRLIIYGQGVPETVLALDFPGAGLDVGTIRIDVPTAMGRIEGRVWHPRPEKGKVWAFAEGYIEGVRLKGLGVVGNGSIGFQTDENGRFTVDRVPAGLTTVLIPEPGGDLVRVFPWSALVVEGQTTVVRAFDPGGGREFTLVFAIGDGSKAQYESGTGLGASRKVDNVNSRTMFRVELVPLSKGPLSFGRPDWEELDAQRKVVLPDVGPGTYRLRVYDFLGSIGFDSGPIFDRVVVVPPGGRGEVRVSLGAGCITGKIPANQYSFAQVTAVAKGSHTPSRWARCDQHGNFCVRYLPPGTYSLFILNHDPKPGFCRVDDVDVPAGVVDVGERALSAGAWLSVAIRYVRPSHMPDEVVAVSPSGVSVRRKFRVDSSFDRIELDGLWPGRWSVSARKGEEVLATNEVDVHGTETFHVTLTTGGGQGQ